VLGVPFAYIYVPRAPQFPQYPVQPERVGFTVELRTLEEALVFNVGHELIGARRERAPSARGRHEGDSPLSAQRLAGAVERAQRGEKRGRIISGAALFNVGHEQGTVSGGTEHVRDVQI
jgi:hypothetical protein